MAVQNLTLKVNQEGLPELVKLSEQFNKNMQEGAAAMRAATAGTAAPQAGTASSRVLSQTAAGTPKASYASYKEENVNYNKQTSVGGTSARDFADQARGLGGLVHLYATFAANIFAAEAAFRALSEAMNTAHLVQGLDQLSAQSGKSLGSLAKQLNAATDGALSLKAAMTSTANASAAGMTNDQILKMGEVAKKASQALGWDMADAMDRLTKGISKNRPQLLDELGIIVNANTIYTDYARTIGKTAGSLSDYEKKQAFANAVLSQGLDKFGAIDIPTNPFTKLEASMSNIAQAVLGFADKILGPIVKYLSESPTGLAIAMSAVASILVKQAVPAMGAFRENAQKMADASYNNLVRAQKDQQKFAEEEDNRLSAAAVKRFQSEQSTQDALSKIKFNARTKGSEPILALTQKDPFSLTQEDIKQIETRATQMLDSKYKTWNEEAIRLQNYLDKVHDIRAKADAAGSQAQADNEAKDMSRLSHQSQLQAIVDKETQASSNRRILAMTAETAATAGPVRAWKDLNNAIAESKAGKATTDAIDELGNKVKLAVPPTDALTNGWTRLKGGLSIATSAVGTAINAFGIWGQVLGLVSAGFAILDGALSKAVAEQNTFNVALDANITSVKTAADAVAYLGDKSKHMFSLEGITSMTNAIGGINDALKGQIKAYEDLIAKQSPYEQMWDSFWSVVNKDNLSNLVKSIGKDIPAALNTMLLSANYDSAKQKFASILHIDEGSLNTDAINKALDKLSKPERIKTIEEIKTALADVTEQERRSTAELSGFAATLADISKEVDTITNKLQFTDGAGKLGVQLQDEALKLGAALQNPIKGLEALSELSNNIKAISLLPQDTADKLMKDKFAIDELKTAYEIAQKAIIKTEAEIEKSKAAGTYSDQAVVTATGDYASTQVGLGKGLEAQKATQESQVVALQSRIRAFTDSQTALVKVIYDEGAKQIGLGLKNAIEQASLTKAKADLSILSAAGIDTSEKTYALKVEELDLQKKVLENAYLQQNAILRNTEQMTLLTAEYAAAKASADMQRSDISKQDKEKATETLKGAQGTIDTVQLARALRGEGGATANATLYAAKAGGTDMSGAMLHNQPFERNAIQLKAATAGVDAQKYAAGDQLKLDKINAQAVKESEIIKVKQDQNNESLASLGLQEQYAGVYTKELADRRLALELKKADLEYDVASMALAKELDNIAVASNIDAKEAENRRLKAMEKFYALIDKHETTKAGVTQTATDKAFVETQKQIAQNNSYANSIIQDNNKLEIQRLAIQEQELSNTLALGRMDEYSYANKKANLDIAKQQANYLVEQVSAQQALAIAKANTANVSTKDQTQPGVAEALVAAKTAEAAAQSRVDAGSKINDMILAEIESTKQQNKLLAEQKDHLAEIADTVGSLTVVFGDVGKAVGSVVTSFDALNTNANKRAEQLKNFSGTEQELANLKKKNTKADLTDTANVLGATKNLFDSKSKSYKALDTIEKSYHIAKLAMDMKEFAVKMGILEAVPVAKVASEAAETAAGTAGAAARAPSLLAEVYAKSIGQLGPIAGPVVATGLIVALMGALAGAGDTSAAAGPSTADIQSAQLTGQKYDSSGQLQSTGLGKFGDPGAQLSGIQDSLDYVGKVFFDNLGSTSSSLQRHLKGIQDNTGKTVAALLKSAGGTISGGISIPATSSSGFGDFMQSIPIIGSALAGLGNAIFGTSKTYSSLDSQLINLSGTVSGLAAGAVSGNITSTVSTQHDKGWADSIFGGGGSYKSIDTYINAFDSSVNQGIALVFKDFNATMLDISKGIGMSSIDMTNALNTLPITISADVTNLSGPKMIEALGAAINTQMNAVIDKAMPWISSFRKVGEDSLTTATRLVKDSETVTYGLKLVGKALGDGTLQDKLMTQQHIIDNFGGSAEAFATAMQDYYNGLFNDSEKLTNAYSTMQDQLKSLGLGTINTNEQLKALIGTINPSSELYASLVKLVPAFTGMTAAMQKMQDAMDSLQGQALDLISTTVGTTADDAAKAAKASQDLKRASVLRNTDPGLKSMQKYVFALEDLKTAEAKLADIRKKNLTITKKTTDDQVNSLKTAISTIDGFITSLDTFSNSLLVGQDSILTPGQKYKQTQQTFSDLLATATTTAITPEQQKMKDAALSQLQSASSDFLNASKLYNASGDQYALDFNLVQSAIMSTSSTLKIQKSVAQSSLDELTAQSTVMQAQLDALDNVTNAIVDTTLAVNDVSAAQQAVSDALADMAKDQNAYGSSIVDTISSGTTSIVTAIIDLPQNIANQQKAAATKAATNAALAAKADTAIADLIKTQGGSSTMQAQEQSAWSQLSDQQKSDYYASNPTMSSITQVLQTLFGYTSMGMAVNAMDPANTKLQSLIAQGDYSGQVDSNGMPIGAEALQSLTQALNESFAAIEANTQATAAQTTATEATTTSDSSNPYSGFSSSQFSGWSSDSSSNGGEAHGGLTGLGPHLVGEYGPELVDYKTPGRIYTANDTAKLFGGHSGGGHNAAVVAELKALRAELSALREQQRQETGHIITAAYDSQDQNAQAVSDAVVSTSDTSAWAAKVAASAKI